MLFKNFCRGALALCAALMIQSAVLTNAMADDMAPMGSGGWVPDPVIASSLPPAQQFGKFSVQIPADFTEVKPIVKTIPAGTDTLYKFVGPKRADNTYPLLLVYVLAPTDDAVARQPLLNNPMPETVEGIHFWNQSSGNINGLSAVHQLWSYRHTGQKNQVTGTEYTCSDGTSTVAVAGLDQATHFDDSRPVFTAVALSLHE